MSEHKVSIILPCYNEKNNIINLINEINQQLSHVDREIILVDDNSPDGTYQFVTDAQLPNTKTILRTEDPGLAKSLRAGVDASTGDVLVLMDSDFNHPPKYLPIMISNLQFYDCVIGSRFQYGGGMDSFAHTFRSWGFNLLIRLLCRKYITDSLFGFIAIKRPVLEQLNFDEIFEGFGEYAIRLLYYLQQRQVPILQIPVKMTPRTEGVSKSRIFSMITNYLKATIKLVLKPSH